MTVTLKPGARLFSAVCSTEVITVKAPADPLDITIGGAPPVLSADERTGAGALPGHAGGSLLGKRYVDESETVELLCTKGGDGVPALDGQPMQIKGAKALPASD